MAPCARVNVNVSSRAHSRPFVITAAMATNDSPQQDEGIEGEKGGGRDVGGEGGKGGREREREGRRAFSLDLLSLAFEVLHSFSGPPDAHVSSPADHPHTALVNTLAPSFLHALCSQTSSCLGIPTLTSSDTSNKANWSPIPMGLSGSLPHIIFGCTV